MAWMRWLQKLAQPVSLQLYAIDLELMKKHYDAALDRLERIMARSARKEIWLARPGELWARPRRMNERRVTFMKVLIAIESLAPQHRKATTVVILQRCLYTVFEQLETAQDGEK